jgi:hypothetical protein
MLFHPFIKFFIQEVHAMIGKIKRDFNKSHHLSVRISIAVCAVLFLVNSSAKSEENNIIIEKNLFSPTRQKWVTPEKVPPKKEVNKVLLPELCGTIVTKKEKIALFRNRQAPQKMQVVAPTRLNKRHPAKQEKQNAAISPRTSITSSYCEGDIINGCLLAKIRENRVRLDCDGELVRLYLH